MQLRSLWYTLRQFRLRPVPRRNIVIGLSLLVASVLGALMLFAQFFGPADTTALPQEFIVKPDTSVFEVTRDLRQAGFIKSSTAFALAYHLYDKGTGIQEGGYKLSASMDTMQIAKLLASPPYMAWVTFPSGWRKEQIAQLLAKKLGWNAETKKRWIEVDTVPSIDFAEGVYYGDTYLIPTDQAPAYVAARLRGRFQDVFAPYAREAARRGIAWTDLITMASLVEREASKNDRALVAGILWNRIHKGMALQVDATLQYLRGGEGDWWPVPTSADKQIDSPFNTYKHVGLPPHPIANPSLQSIEAALNPQATNCLYYIHDSTGTIRCSATYAGHLANVNRYLR